jgi:purine-binding chemotaxis protein CheW
MRKVEMEGQESTVSAVSRSYILLSVAGTTYAAQVGSVRHLEMVEHVTPVPNAPPYIEGVVLSRGQVVPVLNLRVRFGFERASRDLRSRLLVVEVAGRMIGLLADDAREFVTIADTSIHPPNDAITGLTGTYLEGVTTIGGRIVLVLNINDVVETVPTAAA